MCFRHLFILIVGKHAPPPISPIINLKSTSSSGNANGGNAKSSKSASSATAATEMATLVPAGNSCAWRLPKPADPEAVSNSIATVTKYPQRKVPALTPEPPVVVEAEKKREGPKSFFERYEEFPDLQGKRLPAAAAPKPVELGAAPLAPLAAIPPIPPISVQMLPPPLPSKLVGGDFNFLEDDDWLDGDSIDYSQNLFQDSEHFLPPIKPAEPHVVVKAKSLLAERCHSSNKKDIWKRTVPPCPVAEEAKVKIKILKRPDPPVEAARIESTKDEVNKETAAKAETLNSVNSVNSVKSVSSVKPTELAAANLVRKFATSLKLTTTNGGTKTEEIATPTATTTATTTEITKKRIVYSSASKTLQMK